MAPCDWEVDPASLGVCPDWTGYAAAVKTAALHQATLFLWAATGRRYGPCPITVRPNQGQYQDPAYRTYPVTPGQDPPVTGPYLSDGVWYNRGCWSRCSCDPGCSIVLRGPVYAITEVLVDGVVIPSTSYRVDVTQGTYYLVRLDGECWPACQDFQADETDVGSFVVAYEIGSPIPPSLEIATAILACQYAKQLADGGVCVLPATMTRLSRQGVEVEVEPPAPNDKKTGIKVVDDIIAMLNPSKRTRPPVLLSPDAPESCDRMTVVHAGGS